MRTPTLAIIPLLVACGPKKPAKPAADDLFPLVEGGTWTDQATFNGRSMTETKVCTQGDLADGRAWVFLEAADIDEQTAMVFPNMFGLGLYRRTPDGIETADARWRSDIGEISKASFQPMLSLPPAPGTTVTWRTESVDRSSVTVVGWESVTVPAGTFDPALHLDLGGKGEAWLAPGVGLVRWELVTGRVEELESWSIP
jgi:hypothetical protein